MIPLFIAVSYYAQIAAKGKAEMKSLLFILLVLVTVSSVPAQENAPDIRNFLRVNKDFCTGGQPRLEHLEKLKADGVKAIINLRQPSEHRAAEEEAKAKELGLRYFNIPVAYGNPNEEQVAEFLKITDDPENRPAFIHCTAAIRVGAFWMIRRVLRDGWKIEDAEREAEKIGLRESPHWVEFARKYIETHRSKASLPSHPLTYGAFTARFDPGGTFSIEGNGWPKMGGTWKTSGSEVEFLMTGGPGGCDGPGKYQFDTDGKQVKFSLVSDDVQNTSDNSRRQHLVTSRHRCPQTSQENHNNIRRRSHLHARIPPPTKEVGRHSVDHTPQASPKVKIFLTSGIQKQDRTFFGVHRFLVWPTRALSFGEIASS